jgi:hypothetical protein
MKKSGPGGPPEVSPRKNFWEPLDCLCPTAGKLAFEDPGCPGPSTVGINPYRYCGRPSVPDRCPRCRHPRSHCLCRCSGASHLSCRRRSHRSCCRTKRRSCCSSSRRTIRRQRSCHWRNPPRQKIHPMSRPSFRLTNRPSFRLTNRRLCCRGCCLRARERRSRAAQPKAPVWPRRPDIPDWSRRIGRRCRSGSPRPDQPA